MSSSRIAPLVYTHASRPEWGRAIVAEEQTDRTTYVFENAGERTFLNERSRLDVVELPAEEREALAKSLLRQRSARARKTRASKAKKVTVASDAD